MGYARTEQDLYDSAFLGEPIASSGVVTLTYDPELGYAQAGHGWFDDPYLVVTAVAVPNTPADAVAIFYVSPWSSGTMIYAYPLPGQTFDTVEAQVTVQAAPLTHQRYYVWLQDPQGDG